MAEAKPIPNQKLRYERERRAWSQQDVADKVGTTPLNVGRWERGVTMPGPYFRQKLCDIFEKTPKELGLVHETAGTETPPASPAQTPSTATSHESPSLLWNVPYNRNPLFTGREDILAQLHDAFLNGEQPIALAQAQAISGLGGIGKTQTAVEYAYRYRDSYEAVFWARADSADLLSSDYLTIAALLALPQRSEQDQSLVVKAVLHWFDTYERWLLILDNADDLEAISPFIPSAGKGHVLLTTRAHSTGTITGRIELDTMGLEEGTFLLLRRAKLLRGNSSSLQAVSETLHSQARAIVEAVDGLPLALDQAGAYIEGTGCSLSDYLKFYKTRRYRLLRMRGESAAGHPEPVATTWSLSFDKVERANPAAAELLRLCAFLHPDSIPESMIVEGATALGLILRPVAEDEMELNEAIGELRKYSLVKRDPELKILNIHRLVQAVIRDGMDKETQREWAERVVKMVNRAFPVVEFTSWPMCQQLLPHAQVCTEFIEQWEIRSMEAALLLQKIGDYLCAREQYSYAQKLFQRSLELRRSLVGNDAPLLIDSMVALAMAYYEQGNYTDAEEMFRQALGASEKAFGLANPRVADILNGLGQLYWQWTKYAEGVEVLLRSLQIRQQVLGTDHSDVADSFNNLALIYLYQGKCNEAELLFEQAAAIWEKAEGPLHPSTLTCKMNIGVTYIRLGKYTEAERILTEVLYQREQVERMVGSRPYDMGFSFFNLGIVYGEIGKYKQAETLHQQALLKWESILGTNHPRISGVLCSLGNFYRIQGKYAQATALYERSLSICKWEISSKVVDIEVANCLSGLAEIFRIQGKYAEAASFHERALFIREQMAGPESLPVASTLNGLGSLSYDLGNYTEAETLFQRALTIREHYLGKSHPYVAYTLSCLASLYFAQCQYGKAEALFTRALSIQDYNLEPDHPQRLETLKNYIKLLYQIHREAEAAELEESLRVFQAK